MNFFYSSFNEIFGEKPLEYFILGKQDGGAILIQFFQRNHLSNIVATVYFEFLQHCSNIVLILFQ